MCVFCEIIKGNIPSAKVYEDDKTLAILDISQTTKGHTLVLPKQHYANLLEIPAEELSELIVKVQKIESGPDQARKRRTASGNHSPFSRSFWLMRTISRVR